MKRCEALVPYFPYLNALTGIHNFLYIIDLLYSITNALSRLELKRAGSEREIRSASAGKVSRSRPFGVFVVSLPGRSSSFVFSGLVVRPLCRRRRSLRLFHGRRRHRSIFLRRRRLQNVVVCPSKFFVLCVENKTTTTRATNFNA